MLANVDAEEETEGCVGAAVRAFVHAKEIAEAVGSRKAGHFPVEGRIEGEYLHCSLRPGVRV